MSTQPRLILVASARVREAAAFESVPDGRAWDDVLDSAEMASRCAARPIVSLPPNAPLPRSEGGGTLWVCDLEQVEAVIARVDGWEAVVFEPSDTSMLDHFRQSRQTLMAHGPLAAGTVLSRSHLGAVLGGGGIGAEFQERLVGCRVCYDLEPGDPITFGVLELPDGASTSSND